MNLHKEAHLFVRFRFFFWLLIGVWTICIVGSFLWNLGQQADRSLQMARRTVQITFENDVLYRRWSANQGGVYVRVSEGCPPNPYLKIPDRDVTTTSGVRLTLVNPAYMARQVNSLAGATGGSRGHLTSLKPIRPENAPDAWETAALRLFEEGVPEVSSIEEMAGGKHLRLMRPFIVDQGCLTCHADQGYRLGDIRGGVSISVPMASLRAIDKPMTARLALAHLGLWVVGLVGIGFFRRSLGKEILGRQRVEDQLRQALAKAEEGDRMLTALMENVPEGITIADASGRLRMVSRCGQELLGGAQVDKSVEEVVAQWTVYEPDGETPMPTEKLPLVRAIQKGEMVHDAELVQKNSRGDKLYLLCNAAPIADGTGRIVAAIAAWRDITERQAAEEALRASERRLVGVLESMPDAFVSFDSNLRYTYLNANAVRLQAARREELLGKDVRVVYPDAESYKTIGQYERVIREQTPLTLTSYHAGFDRWVEVRAFPTPDGVSVFYKDVSAQVKAEEALRASEEKYRNLFENMAEEVHFWQLVRDETGTIKTWRLVDANPPTLKTWGRQSVEEIRGKTTDEIFGPGATEHYLPVVQKIMSAGVAHSFEDYFAHLDKHFRFTSVPLGDHFITTGADITAIKKAQESLNTSLAEKEVLLKEIHHRVKNNMQVISSLVALQADRLPDDAMRAVLQDVTYRVRSMALVHEKLYQSADMARVEFAEYVQSLLDYLWRAHGSTASGIRLVTDLQPVPLSVNAAVPCGLVLNELVSNALKHAFRGRAGGEVAVSLRGGPDAGVCLQVRDNGTGLPPGLDWRKTDSLGLRLVQILAGQLRATVEVSGGEGTEFTVTFGNEKP